MVDPSLLEPRSLALYHEIARRDPFWLDLAVNVGEDILTLSLEWNQWPGDTIANEEAVSDNDKAFFAIQFPSPVHGNPSLHFRTIMAEEGMEIWLGSCSYQFYVTRWFRRVLPSDELDDVEDYIAKIVMEDLIAAVWKRGMHGLFVSRKYWRKLQEKKRLIRSWSWLGNYNYSESGEIHPPSEEPTTFSPSALFPFYRCPDCQTLLHVTPEGITRRGMPCSACGAKNQW